MHIPWHPKVISNLENIRTLIKLSKNDKYIFFKSCTLSFYFINKSGQCNSIQKAKQTKRKKGFEIINICIRQQRTM